MAIYFEATMDFSVDPSVPDAWAAATANIIQPYVDAGYMSPTNSWEPNIGTWHPTTGIYVTRRNWTDETQANTCAAQIQAVRSGNAQFQAYTTGPVVHNQ